VGDEHDGRAAFAVQRLEQLEDSVTGGVVEIAGRLVGKQDLWGVCECARNRDPLLLATGQLGGKWCPLPLSPTRSISSRARSSAPGEPRSSRGTCTFSCAVRVGISWKL